jgi:ribosomal protein L17
MKVVAPRLVMHYFANAGKKEEGSIRRMAQAFVETDPATRTTARRAADERAAFDAIVTSGKANAIAVPKAQGARVEAELQAIDSRWHKAVEAGGLDLFVPG